MYLFLLTPALIRANITHDVTEQKMAPETDASECRNFLLSQVVPYTLSIYRKS